MRTNIDVDEELVTQIRRATGLASKRSIVDAALRHYVAALAEDPEPATRALGEEMRDDRTKRVLGESPSARIEGALALGEEQLRLAARRAGITDLEARQLHELGKDRTRRRAV